MHLRHRAYFAYALVVGLFFTGCTGDEAAKRTQSSQSPKPAPQVTRPASPVATPVAPAPRPKKAPTPDLAAAPTIDLAQNFRRLHLYQNGALVVPFGTDGVHAYSQAYRRPFADIVDRDGVAARRLKRRSMALTLPWRDGQATTAAIWVWGQKGLRVELKVNGRRVGVKPTSEGWNYLSFAVKEGTLRRGENEVQIHANKAPVIHSLIIGAPSEMAVPPRIDPRDSQNSTSLSGFDHISFWTEIPKHAWLSFRGSASSPTQGEIRIATSYDEAHVLNTFEASKIGDEQFIDLSDYAGKLVRLDLRGAGIRWEDTAIRLQAATIRPKPVFRNAILIVVDALRSDRLKLYGDTRVETPNITREGKSRGAVFTRSQAASPSSPPSHGTIQSGQIARVHGVAGDKGNLKPGAYLMSKGLADAGFATAYVGNNPFGMRRLKAAGGWDTYIEPNRRGLGIDCTAVVDQTLKYVEAQAKKDRRFFVSALPFETHAPYRFHEGITSKYYDGSWGPPVKKHVDGYLLNDLAAGRKVLNAEQWRQLKALYAGEVEHMDTCFGTLVDGLEKLNVYDDTLIVLTSDHGEAMFERGKMGHAYGLYAELMDVPIILFGKGLGPVVVDTPTGVVDIVPTVLDLLGVEGSPRIQGRSTVPEMQRGGLWTPRVVSSEYGRAYTLRSRDWRLLVNYDGTQELYHESVDPKEKKNVLNDHDFELRYLREIAGFFLTYRSDWHADDWGAWNNHRTGFAAPSN